LRLIEREGADRLIGLDTRPFPYLVGQARAGADTIGEARALEDEDGLDRCPSRFPHVRRVCATAARALAGALEEPGADAASPISKQIYAQAMAICEGFMALAPLRHNVENLRLNTGQARPRPSSRVLSVPWMPSRRIAPSSASRSPRPTRLARPARRARLGARAAIVQRHALPELLARVLAGRGVEVDEAVGYLDPTCAS